MENLASESKPGRAYLLVLGGVGIVMILLLGYLAVDRSLRSLAQEDARLVAEGEAAILGEGLDAELGKFAMVPLVLADDPQVAQVLRGDRALVRRVNERLSAIADETGAAALYLIDRDGTALAASNFDRPASFVGARYGFRGYFLRAMANGEGSEFALGTVSRRPGLYIARRVGPAEDPAGVVAVKVEFDALEKSWEQATDGAYVTDADGIVLIASNPEWRFSATQPIDPGVRDSEADTQQFGAAAFRRFTPPQGRIVTIPMLELRRPVAPEGWELHLLVDPATAVEAATANARLGLLLALLALGAAAALVWWARRRSDIREAERLQQRTARLREQLQQANRLATLGQITAGVGHEIRQPVTAVRVLAENGERLVAREEYQGLADIFGRITALSERIGTITDELRRFSRRREHAPREVPIAQVIEGAMLLLSDRIAGAEIALSLPDAEAAQATVRGEHVALEQVLVNLIQNAIDAAGRGGRIALSAETGEKACRLRVADNGPGLGEAQRAELFQPFATTKPEGLGLGLVISQDIMRSLGGDLRAEHPAVGACFVMEIPRA